MTQPRAVEFYGLERFTMSDLDAMQDRLYEEFQARAAALFQQDRTTATRESTAQSGVLSGLNVSIQSGLILAIADGEALIYDSTAVAPDSSYRMARVDGLVAGLPTTRTVTLAAADPTNPRIDAIYVQPATAVLGSETIAVAIRDAVTRLISSSSKAKRTRPSAVLGVVTGTPGGSPAAPAIPAGSVLLAYAYVPAAASTPSQLSDERDFLEPSALRNAHGVLAGCGLTFQSQTQLTLTAGTLVLNGEVYQVPLAGVTFNPNSFVDGAGSLAAGGAGTYYAYVFRRRSTNATRLSGVKYSLVLSKNNAPAADGTPTAALNGGTLPVQLGGVQSQAVCVGVLTFDGANITSSTVRAIRSLHTENETHAGAEDFTAGSISVATPSAAAHAVRKDYVDARAGNSAALFRAGAGVALNNNATDQKFNSFDTSKVVGAMTSDGTGRLTVTNAGTYRIFMAGTVNTSAITGSTFTITFKIFKGNGGGAAAFLATLAGPLSKIVANAVEAIHAAGEIEVDLIAGDWIEFWSNSGGGGAGNGVLQNAQLTIERKA